jgi:hypothetical protein
MPQSVKLSTAKPKLSTTTPIGKVIHSTTLGYPPIAKPSQEQVVDKSLLLSIFIITKDMPTCWHLLLFKYRKICAYMPESMSFI